jgi:hypothetical protein
LVAEPQDTRATEGEPVRFTAKAEGIPTPAYQWFSVDRAGNETVLPGETKPELIVPNPALGVSRYVVNAINSMGNVQSRVTTLSVEKKLKLAAARAGTGTPVAAKAVIYQKTEEEIESQQQRIEEEKAQELFARRQWRNIILLGFLAIILIAGAGVFAWHQWFSKKLPNTNLTTSQPAAVSTATSSKNSSNAAPGIIKPAENHDTQGALNRLPLPTYPLPPGWTKMVIGNVANVSVDFIPSRFDLSAFAEGFFTNNDNILFVCKTNKGGGFETSVPVINPTSAVRRCGIMMRESRATNSPFLFIGVSLEKIFTYRRDSEEGFSYSSWEIPKANQGMLVFLKFDQQFNVYTPAFSFDNQNWFPFASLAFPPKQQLLEGFALYSGDSSSRVDARFVELPTTNESANK